MMTLVRIEFNNGLPPRELYLDKEQLIRLDQTRRTTEKLNGGAPDTVFDLPYHPSTDSNTEWHLLFSLETVAAVTPI